MEKKARLKEEAEQHQLMQRRLGGINGCKSQSCLGYYDRGQPKDFFSRQMANERARQLEEKDRELRRQQKEYERRQKEFKKQRKKEQKELKKREKELKKRRKEMEREQRQLEGLNRSSRPATASVRYSEYGQNGAHHRESQISRLSNQFGVGQEMVSIHRFFDDSSSDSDDMNFDIPNGNGTQYRAEIMTFGPGGVETHVTFNNGEVTNHVGNADASFNDILNGLIRRMNLQNPRRRRPATRELIDNLEGVEITEDQYEYKEQKGQNLPPECSICIDLLNENTVRLGCSHLFHRQCISQWLEIHNACPVCREPIRG
mmetsp:Transcript_34556/g.40005  ORF Transcript_34556/g.40005 Transcript_34556/m.40005 type:complete len:316 (-) Transcript_34556:30-977(-)